MDEKRIERDLVQREEEERRRRGKRCAELNGDWEKSGTD